MIGTGASAIQFVPQIQPAVDAAAPLPAHRAVGHAAPRPPLHPARARRLPALPGAPAARCARRSTGPARRSRSRCCGSRCAPLLRRVGEAHLRRQVADPELRAKLTPDYLPGCKRILVANDYLPSLARAERRGASRDGIAEVRGRSIVGADGTEREVDTIILGTGFHVLDMPIADRIRDGDGPLAAEHWDGSPQAHRGHDGRRLSEPLLPARPEHRASATTRSSTWPRRRPTTCSQALAHLRDAAVASARGRRRGRSARWNDGDPARG